MRLTHLATILALAGSAALAQQDRRVELLAAQEAARAELRGQILAFSVANGVSVKDLVAADPSFDVDGLTSSSQNVGGPRWVEQDVVQVRMQVAGSRVIDRIEPLGKSARLSDADVKRLQNDWAKRNFQATGQAIPLAKIPTIVSQAQSPAWRDVPQDTRVDAANRAHYAAVNSIVQNSGAIQLAPGRTVADSFVSPDAPAKLRTWASTLPATRVALGDDRQVEMTIFVDKEGLNQQVKSLVNADAISAPESLTAIDSAIARMPTVSSGRAGVVEKTSPPTVARQGEIHGMPDWIANWMSEPLVAEGTAAKDQSKLKTARQAEQAAHDALRNKIMALKVDEARTIREMCNADPKAAQSLERAIARARVYQVDYNADGSATVRVTLDPNEVLDELNGPR